MSGSRDRDNGCYNKNNVLSYEDVYKHVLEKQASGEISENSNVDSCLEMIFVHCMLIFPKVTDKSASLAYKFFKFFVKTQREQNGNNKLTGTSPSQQIGQGLFNFPFSSQNKIQDKNMEPNSVYVEDNIGLNVSKANYQVNKSCYYVNGNHIFLTITGPNTIDSASAGTLKEMTTNSSSVPLYIEGRIENSVKRPDNYTKASSLTTSMIVDDSTLVKAVVTLFTIVSGVIYLVPDESRKTFETLDVSENDDDIVTLYNELNEIQKAGKINELANYILQLNSFSKMKGDVLLYAIQKMLPSFFTELYQMCNTSDKPIYIHTYGWNYGGSAAIVAALIAQKFCSLYCPGKIVEVSCRALSPKTFIRGNVNESSGGGFFKKTKMEILAEQIENSFKKIKNTIQPSKPNIDYVWIASKGDMQASVNSTLDRLNIFNTKMFMPKKRVELDENNYKATGAGVSGAAHGNFTYTTVFTSEQKHGLSSIFEGNYDYLLTVNPENKNIRKCDNQTTGGKLTVKTLRDLAKHYDIKGRSKMTKDELQVEVKKAQSKEKARMTRAANKNIKAAVNKEPAKKRTVNKDMNANTKSVKKVTTTNKSRV